MTGRSAAVQGGLAAVGLLVAHLTWQREPERTPGEVAVIEASKNDIARVHYDDLETTMDLQRKSEAGDPVIWMHLVEKPKTAGDKAHPAAPPSPPRDVKGSADALKLYDRFAPLMAPRAFGVLEAAKLKELGLDAPTRHLEVVVKGETRKYDIGIAQNAQNSESFLRDLRDGRVYLMPHGLLAELGNGKRLVDPRLHLFETRDFDRLTVAAGGKRKEFVHVGRESFATEAYAPAKTPDKRDQMVKNWHESVWRSFPMEVLGRGEAPKEGEPKVLVRLDYLEGSKTVGWLELGRPNTPARPPTSEGAGAGGDLYARSEHTVGWTKLHAGEQLLTDAEKLVAAP